MWQMKDFLTRFSVCDSDMRPGIRWWLPGANLDDLELIRELEDMHQAGIGAVELSCQNQNGDGWGSAQWFSHFKIILREAGKRNMKVDFMPGVHWVTTAIDLALYDTGSEKELVSCSDTKTLPREPIRWSIPVPPPRSGGNGNHDFDHRAPVEQGVFLGAVIRNPENGEIAFQMEGSEDWVLLAEGFNLSLEWTPPSEGEWELLSFWELPTGILVRGNPAIDHFHPDGTGAVIAWWNRKLEQDPELKQLIGKHARYLFLDSLELGTKRLWSHGMLQEFRRRRGYDLLPELEVKDGMLLPKGPGYRGILLLNQQTISLHGVRCLTRYAQKGLPILIVGSVPSRSPFDRETGIDQAIHQLLSLKNVHRIAGLQDAADLLSRLNILPAAMPKAPTGLLCAHRTNRCGDYYYLLAQEKQAGNQKTTLSGSAIHTELTLKGTGSVYRLNPWTGKALILPTLRAGILRSWRL